MQQKIRLLISDSTDSSFNLAVENSIFSHLDTKQEVLFLWRNSETVVIGRAQNPWKECNLKKMQEDGIKLSRRTSGGGAVYQDLGNSCFTFMGGKENFDKEKYAQIIINAFKGFGIEIHASGRNDLIVNTEKGIRKVSGSAYRKTHDRGFYHGTMLLSVDLNKMEEYLNPDKKKLETKGIDSVRSRVMNLSEIKPEIDHNLFCKAVIEGFFQFSGERVEAEHISPENMPDLPNFKEIFATQSSWEWNLGNTPEFNHSLEQRFDWGGIELKMNVVKAKIVDVSFFSDSLDPTPLEKLMSFLAGTDYNPESIYQVFEPLISSYENNTQLIDVRNWLVQSVR